MKKILLVLAMIAASVFLAQPAVAADTDAPADPGVETTTEAAEPEPAPEAAAEPVAPAPEEQAPDTSTPPPADTGETPPTVNEEEPPPVDDANKTDDAPDESTSGNAPNVEAVEAAPVKIPICHSTSSQSNPYVQNSPNASGDLHGHTGHTGGIFPAPGWGDIIPPFVFGNVNFPGMNWTTAGQAIYNNNCNVPNEVPIPLIDATAVPPTATPPTCLADGALVLPTTEGVIYESTPAGTGPGNYTVTASAAVGYVLTNPLYEEPIQVLAQLTGPQCQVNGLLPATPGVTTSAATCSANGGLVFNDDPKIIYIVVPFFGNSVLVVALPAPGYYLTQFPFIKVVPDSAEADGLAMRLGRPDDLPSDEQQCQSVQRDRPGHGRRRERSRHGARRSDLEPDAEGPGHRVGRHHPAVPLQQCRLSRAELDSRGPGHPGQRMCPC